MYTLWCPLTPGSHRDYLHLFSNTVQHCTQPRWLNAWSHTQNCFLFNMFEITWLVCVQYTDNSVWCELVLNISSWSSSLVSINVSLQIQKLCDRVASSTLLEDRRDAVRALKSLSKVRCSDRVSQLCLSVCLSVSVCLSEIFLSVFIFHTVYISISLPVFCKLLLIFNHRCYIFEHSNFIYLVN